MSLHRARARRNVRMTQIAALGMAGLAGLLVAMPAPPVLSPGADKIDPASPPSGPQVPGESSAPDYSVAADVLGTRVEKKAEVKAEAKPKSEDPPPDVKPVEHEPEKEGPHYRYAGIIKTPKRDFALLVDPEGRSTFVAQGDQIGNFILLGVSSERIVLADCDDNRTEQAIEQRPENAPHDSTLSMGAPTQAPATKRPGNPTPGTAGQEGEMPPIHVPGNNPNPSITDPKMQERYREIEKRREEMERNSKGVQPPVRPNPNGVNNTPQTRPSTPANKTQAKPDVK